MYVGKNIPEYILMPFSTLKIKCIVNYIIGDMFVRNILISLKFSTDILYTMYTQ